jgi:2-C-methyl-D-erythritol 4-phosphate cytidylyltransferase / 2-C-methyl-D-erythritol 2,4-cyclodiphosphate synthase
MPRTFVIVLAAGTGSRAGGSPKQMRSLDGVPVFAHSLRVFMETLPTAHFLIAFADTDQIDTGREWINAHASVTSDQVTMVTGGATRAHSVWRALVAAHATSDDLVLIHDAARPFPSPGLILRVVAALHESDAVVPALGVVDALRKVEDNGASAAVSRNGLWRVQTPQGFRFGPLKSAYDRHDDAGLAGFADDASLVESCGSAIHLVEGDEANFKITVPDDFARAEQWLCGNADNVQTMTGHGFDVHRFGAARPLVLCGVEIPYETGLIGHSDADVGLHALTDAILGAIGDGDIGQHFSPRDARWANADSGLFLREAVSRARSGGYKITHVDVTLICEAPRIGPHRANMIAVIGEITGASVISVKATTTEGLGFTGRAEGIAAMATATLRRHHG